MGIFRAKAMDRFNGSFSNAHIFANNLPSSICYSYYLKEMNIERWIYQKFSISLSKSWMNEYESRTVIMVLFFEKYALSICWIAFEISSMFEKSCQYFVFAESQQNEVLQNILTIFWHRSCELIFPRQTVKSWAPAKSESYLTSPHQD